MKITKQNKNSNKKLIILLSVVGGVLLVAAAIYLTVFKGTLLGWQPLAPAALPTNATTQDSTDTSHGTKEDTTTGTDKTTDQIPVSETLVAVFDDLSQSGGYVTFSGTANDTTPGGSCSIVFSSPENRPVSRTAEATITSGKAVCGPIKISENEFSFLGEWTATFRYYSGDIQAVVERKITIQ